MELPIYECYAKNAELTSRLTKPRRSNKSNWDREEIKKRAKKDAEEIITKARVRETFRKHFKSIRLENRSK